MERQQPTSSQLHQGHRKRLKGQFLRQGLEHMEPHNVLELLLFFALPRVDTNELAHRLLRQFGSLSAVLEAPAQELCRVKGLGENAAVLLRLMPELARYYLKDKAKVGVLVNSSRRAGEFLLPRFVGQTQEVVQLLCLDNRGKVLFADCISQGSVGAAAVTVRSIAEVAMRVGASAVVLAHNHPRGFAIPSQQDISSTLQLREALRPLEIRLLDHIIVAEDDFVSLADSGFLEGF